MKHSRRRKIDPGGADMSSWGVVSMTGSNGKIASTIVEWWMRMTVSLTSKTVAVQVEETGMKRESGKLGPREKSVGQESNESSVRVSAVNTHRSGRR